METDLLVLGANGLLGSNVFAAARRRGTGVSGTYHSEPPAFAPGTRLDRLDLQDTAAFREILDAVDPGVVVNCAAMTDVDDCERDPEIAWAINADAPGRLASVCADRGVGFVHVSTDYVFGGDAETPYGESDDPAPIQAYGRSKLAGERAVRETHDRPLQVRLAFVWGVHRSTGDLTGFPAWVRDRLARGERTELFVDQHVTPTRAGAAAATILDLVAADAGGLFHVAARSCVTPYDFGTALRDRIDPPGTVVRGERSALDRPADRPRFSCLDVEKVEATLGRPQPTLAADLAAVSGSL